MTNTHGTVVVREDTIIKGEISNCRQIEIHGYVEGNLGAGKLLIHKSGRFYGTVKADSAEIHGTLQGEVFVKHLISIRSSGSVTGNVQYGGMAMEHGGNLSADVRNVPPMIAGDLELTVEKGRSVRITLEDLTAIDPDDTAKNLKFTVSNARNGFVTLAGGVSSPLNRFTQADLEGGKILFLHDGTDTAAASFDVVVADSSGATSGAAQKVNVAVKSRR